MSRKLLALLLLWLLAPAQAAETLWHSRDGKGQPEIHLYFFWTKQCPHCQAALPFAQELPARLPWLRLHSHELSDPANVKLYISMAAQFSQAGNSVPAFLFCGQMPVGFNTAADTGQFLEQQLRGCHAKQLVPASDASQPAAIVLPSLQVPGLGELDASAYSLPVYTLIIAGLDAFNPCAFFVLMFLLSLLVHARSRARMLLIGGVFVFFSGLIYFLFMAAWLNVFLWIGQVKLVTFVAGLLAVFIALVNIKDFFRLHRGISLSIPESAKPGLFQRMRGLLSADHFGALLLGTVTLAIAANAYELLCTSGFPMVYTRMLTLARLSTQEYYLYLLFYNVIYVIPLLLIVLLFTWTLGTRKLQEAEGRLLKLISGLMMLGLGLLLLFAPQLLSNLWAALGILAAALGLGGWAHRKRDN
jgi:hypothetical protein